MELCQLSATQAAEKIRQEISPVELVGPPSTH